MTMMKRYESCQDSKSAVVLLERSMRGMREVFLELNRKRTPLSEVDASFLADLCSMGERLYEGDQVQLAIYMTCSDEEMLARVRARARDEEAQAT
jgi:deoxyadenosine/deoxycytidine kinase